MVNFESTHVHVKKSCKKSRAKKVVQKKSCIKSRAKKVVQKRSCKKSRAKKVVQKKWWKEVMALTGLRKTINRHCVLVFILKQPSTTTGTKNKYNSRPSVFIARIINLAKVGGCPYQTFRTGSAETKELII